MDDFNTALLAALLATLRELETPANVVRVLADVLPERLESREAELVLEVLEGLPERRGRVEGACGETYRVSDGEIAVEGCPWRPVCDLVESAVGNVLCPVALLIAALNEVWFERVERGEDGCRLILPRG